MMTTHRRDGCRVLHEILASTLSLPGKTGPCAHVHKVSQNLQRPSQSGCKMRFPTDNHMSNAWSRSYPSGHRARITKSFESTYSLEVFTPDGERLLDFALLMPSLDLAKETAD